MEKQDFIQALQTLKASSPKRKFTQSIDLIINLKDINLKQTDQQVDLYINLNFSNGKKRKICALIGLEMLEQAKKVCDKVITTEEFERLTKKDIKKISSDYDFFIAQANIMTTVAKFFGRILGPKGKMPNPKAGCVVPPNANLTLTCDKLQKTVHVKAKTEYAVKARVGTESMDENQVIDNMLTIYNTVVHALPAEQNNIKNILLKTTMSAPLVVGAAGKAEIAKKKIARKQKAETGEAQ
ncbi:50S ribosomal protein L1 [Candidatus Woesearchaeota archaeon]|nr:50S ribosomal protein L1 [Candidatus Woesearchaeota archaeon]